MVRPLEERYRTVRDLLPEFRVEKIHGRIIVNETGTWQHNTIIFQVLSQIADPVAERGWEIWPNITIYLGPDDDQYVPDLTVVPMNPRMERDHAVHGDSTVLVADVVSVSNSYECHFVKPRSYAPRGVPLYMVIDPYQRLVKLHSRPAGGDYTDETVAFMGVPLKLPDPWNCTIETKKMLDL
ncbi:Uma2 family endonuclease [Nonomuraea sp. NN258]|uniref:Uma2 family endonuclease n=1 Tax=Nonomuraea antri TaxID=2730852 RepID=UPI001569563A|nr:Uma2 family endonuclease [Nonomuraea antri]NRQ37197.1 Uma2 family endonuclease [Nonomuraea antri]